MLSISAPTDGDAIDMQFEAGDLTAPGGAVLPADRIAVEPSRIRLSAGEEADVAIRLTVHDLAEPGRYQGRIHGTGSERTDITVVFDVVTG